MSLDTDLTGRTAIVTGAASGIGRGIALELADAGANVVVADVQRRPDADTTPTHEAIVASGGDALFHETDVTDPDQLDDVVEATVEAFDGVDVLVHNAGISHDGTIETTTDEEWDAVMDVNLKAIFRLSKAAMEHLRESEAPRIVVVASQLGLVAQPRRPAYVASKGGAIALARQMAVDYADVPIPVNAVCPGVVRTPMTEPLFDDDERRSLLERETLLPYLGEPKDVGMMVTYLSSDAARFVTGQAFVVDGGYTAH
jgi:NAD(P)-dependent dehydrogenase (short-subunit alcohol dehydrogenase family)